MEGFIEQVARGFAALQKDMAGCGDWRKRHYFIVKTPSGFRENFRVCTLGIPPEEAKADIAKNYRAFFYVGAVSNN